MLQTAPFTVHYRVDHGDMYRLLLAIFSSIGGIYMIMYTLNMIAICFMCSDAYAQVPSSDSQAFDKGRESELSEETTFDSRVRNTDLV